MIIREATASDAELLTRMGIEIFVDVFGHMYSEEDLKHFIAETYSPEKQLAEIESPDSTCLLTEIDGKPVGYAKYGKCKLPVDMNGQKAGEIHRIYIYDEYRRSGAGRAMMEVALDDMIARGGTDIYIGVWSENFKAQNFYRNFGFTKFGEYNFMVGKQADHEFILHKRVTAALAVI